MTHQRAGRSLTRSPVAGTGIGWNRVFARRSRCLTVPLLCMQGLLFGACCFGQPGLSGPLSGASITNRYVRTRRVSPERCTQYKRRRKHPGENTIAHRTWNCLRPCSGCQYGHRRVSQTLLLLHYAVQVVSTRAVYACCLCPTS